MCVCVAAERNLVSVIHFGFSIPFYVFAHSQTSFIFQIIYFFFKFEHISGRFDATTPNPASSAKSIISPKCQIDVTSNRSNRQIARIILTSIRVGCVRPATTPHRPKLVILGKHPSFLPPSPLLGCSFPNDSLCAAHGFFPYSMTFLLELNFFVLSFHFKQKWF